MKKMSVAFMFIFFSIVAGFIILFIGNRQVFNDVKIEVQEFLPQNSGEEISEQNMDVLLAEDLSLTTQMFLSQLSLQLNRWAKNDLSSAELKTRFEQELKDHPHFESFAIRTNNTLDSYPDGKITEETLSQLKHKSNNMLFSDPYKQGEKQYFLIAETIDDEKTVIGEVDLTFMKHFIKDIAAVADANGNFFASGDNPNMQWKTTNELPAHVASKTVPELGWQIVVQSEKEEKKRPFHERQAVIKMKENENFQHWITEHEDDIHLVKDTNPYFIIESKKHSTETLLQLLKKDPHIDFAEPNYLFTNQAMSSLPNLPNDEFFAPYQWNLSQIDVESGWELTEGSEEVIIAIIDTGVDVQHQDLKDKVIQGYNALDQSSDVTDTHGHGTHVAGIAAAVTNNITGIAGVAKQNKILPIKVLDNKGEGTSFEVAEGIRYAVDQGASIINLSLGDYYNSRVLKDAIRYAYEHDVVLIAASGNDNVRDPMYPAKYKEVLTVGAVNENRERAFFSNYGNHLDVAAPGEHIPSTFPDNHYVIMSGTSMAAPHVSGLAALIRSVNPNLTNEDIYDIIRHTAIDLGKKGHDRYYGYGEINIAEALKEALRKDNTQE